MCFQVYARGTPRVLAVYNAECYIEVLSRTSRYRPSVTNRCSTTAYHRTACLLVTGNYNQKLPDNGTFIAQFFLRQSLEITYLTMTYARMFNGCLWLSVEWRKCQVDTYLPRCMLSTHKLFLSILYELLNRTSDFNIHDRMSNKNELAWS